jgi:hypothetical protein
VLTAGIPMPVKVLTMETVELGGVECHLSATAARIFRSVLAAAGRRHRVANYSLLTRLIAGGE